MITDSNSPKLRDYAALIMLAAQAEKIAETYANSSIAADLNQALHHLNAAAANYWLSQLNQQPIVQTDCTFGR